MQEQPIIKEMAATIGLVHPPVMATHTISPSTHQLSLHQQVITNMPASASAYNLEKTINRTDTTQRNKFISSPYNFPYSGYYNYEGGVDLQGSNGNWWSRSSSTTAGQAYNFRLSTNGLVVPQNNHFVGNGFAVRCVAE